MSVSPKKGLLFLRKALDVAFLWKTMGK